MVSRENPFLFGFSGRAGNLVVKNYGGKIVISKLADMSKRVLSEKQKETNRLMKRANAMARMILAEPELKKEACETLNVAPNKVYRAYVKEYMKRKGEDRILPSLAEKPRVATGDPKDHIEIDPEVMNGKPFIKNTNITVEEILDMLAKGHTFPEVIAACRDIRTPDIMAALAYAAKLASI